jgi:hypothetical protein
MTTRLKIERKRARWRRNKAAARARSSPPQGAPSPELVARVFAERDSRAVVPRDAGFLWRYSAFFKEGSWQKATAFAADVWAATVLLEHQFGVGQATPTRIARWLINNGRDHGYTIGSIRTQVYQARKRIKVLEQDHEWWGGPFWHESSGIEE